MMVRSVLLKRSSMPIVSSKNSSTCFGYRHASNSPLTISLSGNEIGNSGAMALVEAVKNCLTIKQLFLFGNEHELEEQLKGALEGPRSRVEKSRSIRQKLSRASRVG